FTWHGAEKDEADGFLHGGMGLLKHYEKREGRLSSQPVLLMIDYYLEEIDTNGTKLPYGVFFPERAVDKVDFGGGVDAGRVEDDFYLDAGGNATEEFSGMDAVLSADMSLLDALSSPVTEKSSRSSKSSPLLVLDGAEWSGVVCEDDWMSAPAQVCYL